MKLITINKKAYHNYEILETYEAGIVLTGPEVKSVKAGKIDLTGSYVTLDKSSIPWLTNLNIAPYPPAKGDQENYQPSRPRKLLLKKKEIASLIGKTKMKGLTIIPLKVYNKHGFIKIEIGLGRGKKKFDKREEIKKRELERKIKEELKYKI
ncbi:MAG: SsrA-binding protein SmpB [Patescibacteria group bacterium]|nr:SsrA-binding protein SmpB [Patescibacteria group bacterium]